MTLDTRIYVQGPVDYREVFVKCNQLIGAHEGINFTDEPIPGWENGERKRGPEDGEWFIWNAPNQGLCALMEVSYRKGGALRAPGGHSRYCEPEADGCDGRSCAPACWLEVSFDTAYGYSGPDGGCSDLHARLVAEFGRWLDGKGIRWSWRNEFTGEIHQGYEGLPDLGTGGLKALDWFTSLTLPAIAASVSDDE